MPFDCPVPDCVHFYSSSPPLRRHLAQTPDAAHQKYQETLYSTLNFNISAAVTATTASWIPLETHAQREVECRVNEDDDDDGDDDRDDDGDDDSEELGLLNPADQRDRELVLETVEEEEELDAIAEVMDGLLRELKLTSEEEMAEYLPVPVLGEELEEETVEYPIHRRLFDPPDPRVTDWHPTGGKVEYVDQTAFDRWMKLTGTQQDEAYKPFRSQIDWELAHWAVKEKIPQGSFNRLLSIPKVSLHFLSWIPLPHESYR